MDPERGPFASEAEGLPSQPASVASEDLGIDAGPSMHAGSSPSRFPDASYMSPAPLGGLPPAHTPERRGSAVRVLDPRAGLSPYPVEASPVPPSTGARSARGTARSPHVSPGLQAHLRKVTSDLAEILDDVSTAGDSVRRSGNSFRSTHGSAGRLVDLESQAPVGAEGEGSAPPREVIEEMVPAHHVRRLTTTIVDMLRSITGTSRVGAAAHARAPSAGGPDGEGAGLLWDTSSEAALEYDQLSESSGFKSDRDTEISAATALLKSQYLPKPEYRGDEVRPFYLDRAGSGRRSPSSDIGGKADPDATGPDLTREEASADYPVPKVLKKDIRWCWTGILVNILFVLGFIAYVTIRAMYTLPLGKSFYYGIVALTVEVLGGLAMLPYGMCLVKRVVQRGGYELEDGAKPPPTAVDYHVRVVIPCYKEPLDVISKTFMAAMYAALPPNCRRSVYLLDDGKDPDKRRFVRSLGMANAVYVSGRKRAKGEMNGKSANINNAMRQLYPPGTPIPLDEVIAVFDADQVANADFFTKTVPRLDGGQDLAMVLSPQTFYNLNGNGDIFNHANVPFWDYMQTGYDALGLISCTGTNFLLRSRAFADAGWFPEWTLTEDFALGIELKKRGWQCAYVNEYLAVGEAPEEVRNCFQQRSRWAKGHFQVFFSRRHNPVFGPGAKGLSRFMRWMYGNVVLSYFSAFIGTPLFMLVPMLTVWFGLFPIVINFWAAVSVTIYGVALTLMFYYARSMAHWKSFWFASVANSILWWAFLKAMYRATLGRWLSGTIVFKVTAKGLQKLNNLPLRDLWMAFLWFIFSLVTLIFGLVHYFNASVIESPLAISLIFMIYNLVPLYLLLQYAVWRPRMFFNTMCKLCQLVSGACMVMGIVLVWLLYPKAYDYKAVLGQSIFFLDTQRVGALPADFTVTWRSSAYLADASASVYLPFNASSTGPLTGGNATAPAPAPGLLNLTRRTGPAAAPAKAGIALAGAGAAAEKAPAPAAAPVKAGISLTPAADGGLRRMFRKLLQLGGAKPAAAGVGAARAPAPGPAAGKLGNATAGNATAGNFTAAPTAVELALLDLVNRTSQSPPPPPPPPSPPPPPVRDEFSLGTLSGSSYMPEADSTVLVNSTSGGWDLTGGWISGMAGGNMKATYPIAFTTALISWAHLAFPKAFEEAKQTAALMDSVRWGADYLTKVHRFDGGKNESLLITRVGDSYSDPLLWYRPEDGGARTAYAINLNGTTQGGVGPAAGADLAGSVAGGLAAAASLFAGSPVPGDAEYGAALLAKARQVYESARFAVAPYSVADYSIGELYNSTTVYDDMAWAAAWLYKATKEESYLGDLYDFYVKHEMAEGEISDYKYAFDWGNVFWPVNVLMAQERGDGTFKTQSEQFLRSWMCANHAVNYTERGRAFNPESNPLGSTANAAMLALIYADVIEAEDGDSAATYRCWALSQLRYILGDSGRSLVVGFGTDPPQRTQDRGAGCPAAPTTCNRVTGLMSPDPDTYELTGALVQGPGRSDYYMDERTNDASRVGIENNAGFIGALAGAALLPTRTWDVCLQSFGIYRSNPVCGDFVAL